MTQGLHEGDDAALKIRMEPAVSGGESGIDTEA